MITLTNDAASGRYAVLVLEDERESGFVLTPEESPEVERLLRTPVRDWFRVDGGGPALPSVRRHAVPWAYVVLAAIARERGELSVLEAVCLGSAERLFAEGIPADDRAALTERVSGRSGREALTVVGEYLEARRDRVEDAVEGYLERLDQELPALLARVESMS